MTEPPAHMGPGDPPGEPAPPTHVRWSGGGEARILTLRADAITLDSTVPSPPGSRIEGSVVAGEGAAARLRVKIHASKRQPDARFLLEGRPLDLSRESRLRLESLMKATGGLPGR